MAAFAVLLVLGAFLFSRLPGGFLPEEDQGYAYVIVQLPPGATLERTMDVMRRIGQMLHQSEAVNRVMQVGGFGFIGQGENVGLGFVQLKPWNERKTKIKDFLRWANMTLGRQIRDADVYAVNLPTVRSLGNFGGFDFFLEDRVGIGHAGLIQAQQTLVQRAGESHVLTNVRASTLAMACACTSMSIACRRRPWAWRSAMSTPRFSSCSPRCTPTTSSIRGA
jgi:multidrug efflux pump